MTKTGIQEKEEETRKNWRPFKPGSMWRRKPFNFPWTEEEWLEAHSTLEEVLPALQIRTKQQ